MFDRRREFSIQELGYEIGKSIITKNFEIEYNQEKSDDIIFKTDTGRQDLYETVLRYVKYLGFTTQPLRSGKPEFKIPKSTVTVKGKHRSRNINIYIKPKSGNIYLKSGWGNRLIYDLIRNRQVPDNLLRTTPDSFAEYEVLRRFNLHVDELCVDVAIKNKLYTSIAGMVPGPAAAKADFVGIDKDGNPKFYISHKEGFGPIDFQQYSGISRSRAGTKISDYHEVKKFVEDIDSKPKPLFPEPKPDATGDEKKSINAYWRTIKDDKLKKYAVFGKEFDDANPGVNNVDFFAQGKLILNTNPITRKVTINFSTLLIPRGSLQKLVGDYEPTLGARKGENSRRIGKHSGVRGGIWASKYIKDRSSKEI